MSPGPDGPDGKCPFWGMDGPHLRQPDVLTILSPDGPYSNSVHPRQPAESVFESSYVCVQRESSVITYNSSVGDTDFSW